MQLVLRYLIRTVEKCTSLKTASYETKKNCKNMYKFQRSIYKRNIFLTLRTQHGASFGVFTEQTLRSDGYGLQIFGNWNQRWSTELRGNRPERSSRTWIVSQNVEGPLQVAMEYLQDAANEYKDNFIGLLTVSVCTLNTTTLVCLDSSSVRIMMIETTLRRMFEFDGLLI